MVLPVMNAISVDTAWEEPVLCGCPVRFLGLRPREGSIAAAGTIRRPMAKPFLDDPIAGVDRQLSVLMIAAQAGDSECYKELLRRCIPFIKNVARRRGVAADRIDDVVQDVLLTIHRARQTYDPSRSFVAWLRVISDRRAIDLIRRTRRQESREIHAPLAFESCADEAADPAQTLAHADNARTVSRALETLPTRQREAVRYLVLEQRSLADVAALTERSKGSLKVNLHRALKALRGRLERTG